MQGPGRTVNSGERGALPAAAAAACSCASRRSARTVSNCRQPGRERWRAGVGRRGPGSRRRRGQRRRRCSGWWRAGCPGFRRMLPSSYTMPVTSQEQQQTGCQAQDGPAPATAPLTSSRSSCLRSMRVGLRFNMREPQTAAQAGTACRQASQRAAHAPQSRRKHAQGASAGCRCQQAIRREPMEAGGGGQRAAAAAAVEKRCLRPAWRPHPPRPLLCCCEAAADCKPLSALLQPCCLPACLHNTSHVPLPLAGRRLSRVYCMESCRAAWLKQRSEGKGERNEEHKRDDQWQAQRARGYTRLPGASASRRCTGAGQCAGARTGHRGAPPHLSRAATLLGAGSSSAAAARRSLGGRVEAGLHQHVLAGSRQASLPPRRRVLVQHPLHHRLVDDCKVRKGAVQGRVSRGWGRSRAWSGAEVRTSSKLRMASERRAAYGQPTAAQPSAIECADEEAA